MNYIHVTFKPFKYLAGHIQRQEQVPNSDENVVLSVSTEARVLEHIQRIRLVARRSNPRQIGSLLSDSRKEFGVWPQERRSAEIRSRTRWQFRRRTISLLSPRRQYVRSR